MKSLGVVCAIALVLSASPSAHAAREDGAHSTIVRFGDLDLNQPAGVVKLYARIQRAARMVCSRRDPSYTDSLTILEATGAEYKICVARAVDTAIRDIGRPNLTRYADLQTRMR